MTPRSLLALALISFLWLSAPAPVAAQELVVVSEEVIAEFPIGITLALTYRSEETIAEASVLYTLANGDVSTEISAELASDGVTSASAEIEMAANFVPAGVDITYRWRLVSASDVELTTEPATVIWEDDRFDWERSSSDDVEVFGYSGGSKLREQVLGSAQETVDRLSVELDVTVELPLRIWVYGSKEDFDGTLAANSQEWVAGAAYPDLQLILAVIPGSRPSEIGRIIPHEVSHQVLGIATDNPYNAPATWVDEGLAVRAQTNGNGEMAGIVEDAQRDGRLLPLTSLSYGFPFDPEDASLAYAQSFSVVTYLLETYGEAALAAISEAYRAGNTHDDVMLAAIGRDIAQLDGEWQAWVQSRAGSLFDLDNLAPVLLYGVPAIGVAIYVVTRIFHRPEPVYDTDDGITGWE